MRHSDWLMCKATTIFGHLLLPRHKARLIFMLKRKPGYQNGFPRLQQSTSTYKSLFSVYAKTSHLLTSRTAAKLSLVILFLLLFLVYPQTFDVPGVLCMFSQSSSAPANLNTILAAIYCTLSAPRTS